MAKKKKKNEFRVRLSEVGNNDFNASYDKMTGKYALEVCNRALVHMIKNMVGKKEINKAIYLMSLHNLKRLHKKFDEKFPELKDDKVEDYLKTYEIKEND